MIKKNENWRLIKSLTLLLALMSSNAVYAEKNIGLNDLIIDNLSMPSTDAALVNMKMFFNFAPAHETCYISLFAYPQPGCTGTIIRAAQVGSANLTLCRNSGLPNYTALKNYQIFGPSAFRALGSFGTLDNTQSMLIVTTRQDASTQTGAACVVAACSSIVGFCSGNGTPGAMN